jgi:hypothetical protein
MSAMPPTAPRMIYVRDFDLKPGSFQPESGILPISPISANVPGAFIPRILGVPEDSGDRERELLKLMSSALVDDLTSAGLNARFLPSAELLPSEGWLVRGAFVQVDEGNRLRRALIGFGSGATRLRVIVWVSDLGHSSSAILCAGYQYSQQQEAWCGAVIRSICRGRAIRDRRARLGHERNTDRGPNCG